MIGLRQPGWVGCALAFLALTHPEQFRSIRQGTGTPTPMPTTHPCTNAGI